MLRGEEREIIKILCFASEFNSQHGGGTGHLPNGLEGLSYQDIVVIVIVSLQCAVKAISGLLC